MVQANPIKPTLKAPGSERLKLKCDILLLTYAFRCNLRRYNPYYYRQGLTLVHLSAQRKHFLWDEGYLGGGWGVFMAGMEGVFRRLGDVLSVRTGLGRAEKWTSVSP